MRPDRFQVFASWCYVWDAYVIAYLKCIITLVLSKEIYKYLYECCLQRQDAELEVLVVDKSL